MIIYLTSDDKRLPHISYAPSFKIYAIWRVIRYILLLIVAHDFGSSDTDLLHVVTQASTNALPVPMLRQVYVEPCEEPFWGPKGAQEGPKGIPKR